MKYHIEGFRFGIEHEFAVVSDSGQFCDFSNTTFEDFDRVIEEMPTIPTDYPGLRVGDLGIKSKRWYIEGFERFSEHGGYLYTVPKGFEIRTPICNSLEEAVTTLAADFEAWRLVAQKYGFRASTTSFNPFAEAYVPDPPLNAWEGEHRKSPEERTAHMHMLTAGPDISFSHPELSADSVIDIGKKLTFYSPFIVPFSFSSPFYRGGLWGGLSRRTYFRTGARPAALVFLKGSDKLIVSSPTLTDLARIESEAGRIEFKAFDTVDDLKLYGSLGALLVGLALDESLDGRALVPDKGMHQLSATHGFYDQQIYEGTARVLEAAYKGLPHDLHPHIDVLQSILASKRTPAHRMIDIYEQTGNVMEAISLSGPLNPLS